MFKIVKKLLLSTILLSLTFNVQAALLVDDFESGLPAGFDGDGTQIGFLTFVEFPATASISTTGSHPSPVPGQAAGNQVMQFETNVGDGQFSGFLHNFENAAVDSWIPQDWSDYTSLDFWLYGSDTGNDLFVDILDNRNAGSTTDDAERWVSEFVDDFNGWGLVSLSFADFTRKDIGNGAPDDGLGLTQMHGWAFGSLSTGGNDVTYYLDDVTAVPEPSIILLFGIGFIGLGFARFKARA